MKVNEYWGKYKEENNIADDVKYESYHFCDNEKDARELSELVLAGKKRATSSNAQLYEAEGEPLPKAGDKCIITDFFDNPLCIIETTQVDIVAFKDVSEKFAAMEGEGDLSLSYWRKGHEYFFTKELEQIGMKFTQDMPVVCEQFKVIYK